MSLNFKRDTPRFWALPAIAAVATVLTAATIDPDGNWLRLRAVPQQERQRLVDNLEKFDVRYRTEQQQAIRDLDRKVNELDPERQAQYLMTLRRYHDWLNQLPEMKQGSLKEKAPGERMALVKKLVAEHPIAPNVSLRFLQFMDVGDHSPIELAAIYQTWKGLSPTERQQVEKMAPGPRRQKLIKRGEKKKISSETEPADVDEELWISEFKSWVQAHRPALLNLLENEVGGTEILRRQAINFHFLELKNQSKPVTPERLAEFLTSFPLWLRTGFDHYPPEEARRRLSVVYRLVFPPGTEINAKPPTPVPSSAVKTKASPPARATPSPAGTTSPGAPNSPI